MKACFLRAISTGVAIAIAFTGALVGQETAAPRNFPAEVVDLTGKYEGAMATASEPLTKLKSLYSSRLESLKSEAQQSGDLDQVLLINNEMKRIETQEPSRKSEWAELAALQAIYHRHAKAAAPRVNLERVRLEGAYIGALETLMTDFTQKGELKTALSIRELLSKAQDRERKWNRLASAGSSNDDPFAHFDWKKLGEIIKANQLTKTLRIGGNPQNNDTTRDVPAEPSILIGFDLHMGPFGGSRETVRRIVPLYRTEKEMISEGIPRAGAKGDKRRRILAKRGYAISGITTQSEAGVRKIKFEFQRLEGMKTVPADSYETDWYGDWDQGRIASLKTDGKLAVGVDGWVGLGTGETWLILAETQ